MGKKSVRPKTKINKQREMEKRKRKKNKNKLTTLLIIVLILALGIFLFTSPTFKIKKITVKGNQQVSNDKIIEMAEVKKGDNIFSQLGIVIKVKLKQHGYIEDAQIHKKYPNEIEIEVTERKKQYKIKTEDESYIYIDEQGYILEISKDKLELPIIIGMELTENDAQNQKRLDQKDLDKMENVLQIMEQCKRIGILEKITQIQVKDEYVITLDSDEIKINLGDATNLKNRFDYVNALLKQEKDNKVTLYVNGNLNEGFLPYFYAE